MPALVLRLQVRQNPNASDNGWLQKPYTCKGCPLYGSGFGFVPDELVEGAEVFVLAQNPGAEEVQQGRPLCGSTGYVMEHDYFPLAGLVRGQNVSLGNVLKCRLEGHCIFPCNHLPPLGTLNEAVAHCTTAYLQIPTAVKLVVAQGALAWRVVSGDIGSVTDWRGFTTECVL